MKFLNEITVLVNTLSMLGSFHGYDVSSLDREQVHCLARNIYHESAGESNYGKLAVAQVTRNRVESKKYPNTYCKVVWERRYSPNQDRMIPMFSWTFDGKPDKVYLKHDNKIDKTTLKVWKQSVVISALVVLKELKDVTCGATHFYAHFKVNPKWAKEFKPACGGDGKIGNHTFLVKEN